MLPYLGQRTVDFTTGPGAPTALAIAISKGKLDATEALLKAGADPMHQCFAKSGGNALHALPRFGSSQAQDECGSLLLRFMKPTALDLRKIFQRGLLFPTALVQQILAAEFDLCAFDNDGIGYTTLELAAQAKAPIEILAEMIRRGASPAIVGQWGESVLHLLVEEQPGESRFVSFLNSPDRSYLRGVLATRNRFWS